MAKPEATAETVETTAPAAKEELVNVSVTLPKTLVEQLDEARWALRQGSRSGAARAIIESHFAK